MAIFAAVALDSLAIFFTNKEAKVVDQRGFGGTLDVWALNRHALDGS